MDKTRSLHHFVPQFYLRNFESRSVGQNHYIFLYQRTREITEPNIRSVGSEKSFYTVQEKSTLKDSSMIEDMFDKIEGKTAPIFKKIIDKDSIYLSEEEKAELDYFLALLYVRTPGFRKVQTDGYKIALKHYLRTMAANRDYFRKSMMEVTETKSNLEIDDLREKAYNFDKYFTLEAEGGESGLLKLALEDSKAIAPCFYMKTLHLITSIGKAVFITSDNPVVLIPQDRLYGKGPIHSTIILPISPKKCILYHNEKKKDKIFISEEQVRKINQCVMSSSNNFIYSNLVSKKILKAFTITPHGDRLASRSMFSASGSLLISSIDPGPYLEKDIFGDRF